MFYNFLLLIKLLQTYSWFATCNNSDINNNVICQYQNIQTYDEEVKISVLPIQLTAKMGLLNVTSVVTHFQMLGKHNNTARGLSGH